MSLFVFPEQHASPRSLTTWLYRSRSLPLASTGFLKNWVKITSITSDSLNLLTSDLHYRLEIKHLDISS